MAITDKIRKAEIAAARLEDRRRRRFHQRIDQQDMRFGQLSGGCDLLADAAYEARLTGKADRHVGAELLGKPYRRHELAAQRTQVLALHMGFVDTDLVRAIEAPKTPPAEIVRLALDGLAAGLDEVLADEPTRQVKQGLVAARPSYLPQLA